MPILVLDNLEFRTPISDYARQNGSTVPLIVSAPWQRRLKSLWDYVQRSTQILPATSTRNVSASDQFAVILCSGTITLTLPTVSTPGDAYYFFNNGVGVITIAGNINGNPGGYTLAAQYKYVQVTSVDGANWIVTVNN